MASAGARWPEVSSPAARPWAVNRDGIPTRHPEPACWGRVTTTTEVLALDSEQSLLMSATHEAGHAALWASMGVPLARVWVRTVAEAVAAEGSGSAAGGVVAGGSSTPIPHLGAMAAAAAGERAEDRWLHENGLWTEARAWVVERHSMHDRVYAFRLVSKDPESEDRLTFGEQPGHPLDYATAHDEADARLEELWPAVLRISNALASKRELKDDDIRRLLRRRNVFHIASNALHSITKRLD